MRIAKNWGAPCPHPACSPYRMKNRGNVRAIATDQPHSGQRRIVACPLWGEECSETRQTVFFALRTPEETVISVLNLWLCNVQLTSIRFAWGVTEETPLARAAARGRARDRDAPTRVVPRPGHRGAVG